MWNNLFDYWKSFSFLGTISLPILGFLFLGTKAINWSSPLGYYTKLKLFVVKKNGTSGHTSSPKFPDLLVEYPTTNLDKSNHWKYCLPKSSKLNTQSTTTATGLSNSEDCQLDWNRTSDSDLINFLLKLGLRFLKLQHQINLLLIYSFWERVKEDNHHKDEMIKKCGLKGKNSQKSLKDFFVSASPISKYCLLVPEEVTMNLSLENGVQTSEIKLEELKKGKINGKVRYSLSNHWGQLHNFSEAQNGASHQGSTKSPISIEVLGRNFDLSLENSTSSGSEANGKLYFDSLFEKYERKELEICDFLKDFQSSGRAGEKMCKSTYK